METSVLVAVIGVLGTLSGIFIGGFLDFCKNHKSRNLDYNMKIFETYRQTASEIIEMLSPMVSLSLHHKNFPPEQLTEWKKRLSYLYFKNYTYLPQEVLNEINCLHSCLQYNGEKIFCIKDGFNIVECDNEDALELFEDTALVGSERTRIETMIREYSVEKFAPSLKINLQARRTIRVIGKIFESKTVKSWNAILKKETLFQHRRAD